MTAWRMSISMLCPSSDLRRQWRRGRLCLRPRLVGHVLGRVQQSLLTSKHAWRQPPEPKLVFVQMRQWLPPPLCLPLSALLPIYCTQFIFLPFLLVPYLDLLQICLEHDVFVCWVAVCNKSADMPIPCAAACIPSIVCVCVPGAPLLGAAMVLVSVWSARDVWRFLSAAAPSHRLVFEFEL